MGRWLPEAISITNGTCQASRGDGPMCDSWSGLSAGHDRFQAGMSSGAGKKRRLESRRGRLKACSTALTVLLLSTPYARAQEVSASLLGSIKDPSGAAVAGAAVTAKDHDRGTMWPTVANSEGIYALPRIPAGRYEVR